MRSLPRLMLVVFSLLAFSPSGFAQPAKSDPARAARNQRYFVLEPVHEIFSPSAFNDNFP